MRKDETFLRIIQETSQHFLPSLFKDFHWLLNVILPKENNKSCLFGITDQRILWLNISGTSLEVLRSRVSCYFRLFSVCCNINFLSPLQMTEQNNVYACPRFCCRNMDFGSFAWLISYSVASRCFLAAFLLQNNLQKLGTPVKIFQKLVFSLKPLEIEKCLRWKLSSSVLITSP